MSLILASASPRRADLLRQVGVTFKIIEPAIHEDMVSSENPDEMVVEIAQKKALDVTRRLISGFVLAADTVVVCQEKVLGKPGDRDEARRMLKMLSGKEHKVFTGLALYDIAAERCQTGFTKTGVWMKALQNRHIDAYVLSGEPLDKAGAYGIQGKGALFIDRIEGCYFNVVGLPLSLLYELFTVMQVPTWFSGKDGNG